MKIVYKYSSSILFVLLLFSSCKKEWFDIKSENKLVVPSTVRDFQALLDNSTMMNSYDVSLGEASSDGHYVSDISYNQFDQNSKNSYIWSQDIPYNRVIEWARVDGTFSYGAYPRIYYCNLILDGLKKVKEQSTEYNNVKGQALFQRARTFHQLAEVFASPYIPGQSDNELGIPLRLEADINISSTRSTLKQTYDQIIGDLLLAKDLVPDLPEFKHRGSKAAIYALLARIYLNANDYENALIYSNLSLQIYSVLMDYNTLNENANLPIIEFNPECIFHSRMNYNGAVRQNYALIDVDLFESYKQSDKRRIVLFRQNISTNAVTFKGSYSGTVAPFTGFATNELFLIRAECYARLGNVVEAMNDLNLLLTKRYEPGFVSQTATDKDDALRQILVERRKELLMRGLRWSDLRRLNRDDRFKVTITRTINGKTYTLEPNSYKYTFPIPDDIIQMTKIPQNKGW